jgi:hypothetical protein
MYDKPMSETLMEFYLRALLPYGAERVTAGIDLLIRQRKYTKFPTIAEIIETIEPGDVVEIRANDAWKTVEWAVTRYGCYRTVRFADPAITRTILAMASSWPDFCNRTACDDREYRWLQREFERRYMTYTKLPPGHLRNETLVGLHDAQNGEPDPKPVLIEITPSVALVSPQNIHRLKQERTKHESAR